MHDQNSLIYTKLNNFDKGENIIFLCRFWFQILSLCFLFAITGAFWRPIRHDRFNSTYQLL